MIRGRGRYIWENGNFYLGDWKGGIDVIDTYVFWNGHEPKEDAYYFEDHFNLVKFVKIAQ